MKKQYLSVLLSIIVIAGKTQPNWFADGGITHSNFSFNKTVMGGGSADARASAYAKMGISLKVHSKLNFETSLGFLSRKYHYHFFVGPDYSGDEFFTHHSIILQTVISRKLFISKKIFFHPGAGIYGAFGINGKMSYLYDSFGGLIKGSRRLNFGNETNDDFKKAELGALAQFRLQYQHVYLHTSAGFSLTKGQAGSVKQTWKTFMAGIGYYFGSVK